MGCCARSADGNFMAAQTRVSFLVSLEELEVIVISLALAADFDLLRIIIESDIKGVIDYIYKRVFE